MKTIYQVLSSKRRQLWQDVSFEEMKAQRAAGVAVRVVQVEPTHFISARIWWGRNGAEYRAELCEVRSGNTVFSIEGTGSAWQYHMRDRMIACGLFAAPARNDEHPTIYFREVAGVEYDEREVSRKRDL